ncbi:MAG: M1 family metallopeptidase, partial [candidate division KSB1 bacterium]|nr:M1 family metallopeptidase [candidate division KSB1 bacterium]
MNYKPIPLLFLWIAWWPLSWAFAEAPYWQQHLHYQMNVRLNPQSQALSGESIITYHNNSPDTLDRIYLHLYPNAFKSNASTFAKEARRNYYGESITPQNSGYIDILEFRITSPDSNVSPNAAEIVAYRVDDTILEATLPQPLPPQQSLQLYIKFYEKVPRLIVRGGRQGNQYDFGQWYPKPVVYDQNGWHPDQYHANGEFYGEFGTFDVTITLPYNYIVCATGVPTAGDPGWSWVRVDTSLNDEQWQEQYDRQLAMIDSLTEEQKERTVTFHAERVHDFAWSACPDFVYEQGEWNGIPIHVLYRSLARDGWSKKVAQRGARVLEWLSTRFGQYPYPQLTIMQGLMGGGMEYPMLVMNSGPWESLISHEVGHIYFYGILANDELAEAWLDEGFTTYQEYWYQHAKFSRWGYEPEDIPDTTTWKFKLNPKLPTKESTTNYLLDYLTSGYNEPISQYAHKFNGGYGINVYTKAAA